jgi:hypothetical protein
MLPPNILMLAEEVTRHIGHVNCTWFMHAPSYSTYKDYINLHRYFAHFFSEEIQARRVSYAPGLSFTAPGIQKLRARSDMHAQP